MNARTVARLENWGRAFRDGHVGGRGRCGSAEGRYVPPKVHDGDLPRSSSYDRDDAERVEQAIIRCGFGPIQRAVLVQVFANRADWRKVCRNLRIQWRLFPATLDYCGTRIEQGLGAR